MKMFVILQILNDYMPSFMGVSEYTQILDCTLAKDVSIERPLIATISVSIVRRLLF